MTTIYDIKMHVLPINVVAKLACCDKTLQAAAITDFHERDVGTDIYQYLTTCGYLRKVVVIYQRLKESVMWQILAACLGTRICYVPCAGPLVINMWANKYDIGMTCSTACYFRYDIADILPRLLRGHAGVCDDSGELYARLAAGISSMVGKDAQQMTAEWNTDAYCFYKVDMVQKKVYVSNFFILGSMLKLEDPVYTDVTRTFLRDVVYSIIQLGLL